MYRSSSPITAEYKLLQLQQYLSVEVQKAIENLGHSAVAYQIARERLEKNILWTMSTHGNLLGGIRKAETSKIW